MIVAIGASAMDIDSQELADGIVKITLAGRMDIAGAQQVDPAFAELTAPPRRRVIVDLAGVNFLTSAGIRTLIVNAKALRPQGGKMVLLNPNGIISRVLELAGLDQSIGIFRDLDAACAAVMREAPGKA